MNSEIKSAIDFFDHPTDFKEEIVFCTNNPKLRVLLDLAKRYLSIEGWPEKKWDLFKHSDEEIEFWNSALDACKLAHLKDKERLLERLSVKNLVDVISKSKVSELAWKYCDLNDEENGDYNLELATAIRKLVEEEK